jgi:hypothetical protein
MLEQQPVVYVYHNLRFSTAWPRTNTVHPYICIDDQFIDTLMVIICYIKDPVHVLSPVPHHGQAAAAVAVVGRRR